MTAGDVASAIRSQNLDAPAGQVGQPPASRSQAFQVPIDALGRLTEPEQFGDIIVKVSKPASTPASSSTPATAATPSPMSSGTSGSGSGTVRSKDPVRWAGPANDLITGSVATSPLTSSGTASGRGTTGGGAPQAVAATTAGGATASGGGTTGGGAMTSGSGNAGGPNLTGQSITSGTTTSATDTGVIAGTTMGRGPGRPSTAIVRLRDVARLELGAQNYTQSCTFDGHPSVGLGVYQLPDTNALDVADRVRKKMEELKTHFPDGVEYQIAYDTTPFIRESVMDVVKTLLEAVALVALVVLFFLQDWRAMILPLIDVPVSIIGTFAVMSALGFSLNNISLFGLVLAIGIVVDDAIVVLENIERMMAKGLDARTAALKAMDEVTGPIVAVALVLCAVFVPCAFISGIIGQFFHQFAVTIAVSTVISAINAITMTPSRAVLIFKTKEGHGGHEHDKEALPWWIFGVLGGLLTLWLGQKFLAGRLGLAATSGGEVPSWLYWATRAAYFSPRRAGRWSDRVVPHPAREHGAGMGLPGLQLPVRPDDRCVWLDGRQGPALDGDRLACLRSADRPDLRGVRCSSHWFHPSAGPGPAHRQHPTA